MTQHFTTVTKDKCMANKMEKPHDTEPYLKCNKCSRKFRTKNGLSIHTKKIHNKCGTCKWKPTIGTNLKVHMNTINGRNKLKRDKSENTNLSEYTCKICDKHSRLNLH